MSGTFRRLVGIAALLGATLSVAYTVTFALFVRKGYHWAHWTSATALMLGGLVAVPVLVGLSRRLRDGEPELAIVALSFGLAGAFRRRHPRRL